MNTNTKQELMCFCTLALGNRYRIHAVKLASDLEQYAKGKTLVVLTDRPEDFSQCTNVIAVYHTQQTLGCYHDKQYVLKESLQRFESCIFLDSDIRILEAIEEPLNWNPGLTAISRSTLEKHFEYLNEAERQLVTQAAQKLGIDISSDALKFMQEYLFAMKKDEGKEREFFETWEKLSRYFELNNFLHGEGFSMGLAAYKAGLDIHLRGESLKKISFFKDWLAKLKFEEGECSTKVKDCLDEHYCIEFSEKFLIRKISNKLRKNIERFYRMMLLRTKSLSDWGFYYGKSS